MPYFTDSKMHIFAHFASVLCFHLNAMQSILGSFFLNDRLNNDVTFNK